jgi:O-acetyl-ADP-ribose deacetylase (regulator of RNase III)
MITYKQGNLLDVTEGVIIHGCNAKGVMASGVALAVKNKYPKAYQAYKDFESKHELRTASISQVRISNGLHVANMITQETYGRDPKVQYVSYGAVHLGFERLHQHYPLATVFHFPKIGAGLGNGDWDAIADLIEFACPGRDLVCWEL